MEKSDDFPERRRVRARSARAVCASIRRRAGSRGGRATGRSAEAAPTARLRVRNQIHELSEIQPLFRPIGSRRSPLHCLPWSERLAPTTQQASVAGMTGRIAASSHTAVHGAAPRPTDRPACQSMVRFRKHVVVNSRNPVSRWTPAARSTRHQRRYAVAARCKHHPVGSSSSLYAVATALRSTSSTQYPQHVLRSTTRHAVGSIAVAVPKYALPLKYQFHAVPATRITPASEAPRDT